MVCECFLNTQAAQYAEQATTFQVWSEQWAQSNIYQESSCIAFFYCLSLTRETFCFAFKRIFTSQMFNSYCILWCWKEIWAPGQVLGGGKCLKNGKKMPNSHNAHAASVCMSPPLLDQTKQKKTCFVFVTNEIFLHSWSLLKDLIETTLYEKCYIMWNICDCKNPPRLHYLKDTDNIPILKLF
jgi:hypothetical protein